MKSIVPAYISMLGFLLMVIMSCTLISAQLQISAARTYHAAVVNNVQASYHSESVKEAYAKDALKRGFDGVDYTDQTISKGRLSELVTLHYTVRVPFLTETGFEGAVSGFAK